MIHAVLHPTIEWSSIHFHVFVEPYRPPVPQLFYLAGAAAAVIVSFIVVGFFAKSSQGYTNYPSAPLLRWTVGKPDGVRLAVWLMQLSSLLLFAVVIATGLWGNPNPVYNFAPTFIWVIWWVGVAYTSAFIGNVWSVLNPWGVTFTWAETLWKQLGLARPFGLGIPYPTWLGIWPGLVLFLSFAWLENVYHDAVLPMRVSQMVLTYSCITWLGMFVFGRQVWLRQGEAFSLAFGFLSRFSPTEARVVDHQSSVPNPNRASLEMTLQEPMAGSGQKRSVLIVRPFGAGLLNTGPISSSQMVFVLLLLATVTFDGLTATSVWPTIQARLDGWLAGTTVIGTVGLAVAILLFIAGYLAFSALMSLAVGGKVGTLQMAKAFVYTLIPIALAYHLAHFLLFLLVQGQLIIPLASDPFGAGWDLFGTATYRINFKLMGPSFYWFTSVIGIVVGHIVAVFLAHNTALRLIQPRKLALRSQYPMLVLMVGYTVASLWIITQPMTMPAM